MPLAIYALMIGAFGIGTTEFVIMGLLQEISRDLGVSISSAGMLISGYALGVAIGAPVLSILAIRSSKKRMLILLMGIFTIGNLICALATDYSLLMIARVVTSFAHGTFFGIGSVVATNVVRKDQKALAIALMFTGLTVANIAGVPFGTWLGQHFGWRSTFWAVTAIGPLAMLALSLFIPTDNGQTEVNLKAELEAIRQPKVISGLAITVVGFAAVFAIFTYISPILTTLTKLPESWISPLLLLFGLGLIFGNIFGGKLADRNLNLALVGSLVALTVVSGAYSLFSDNYLAMFVLVFLLGFAGFATVPPLQMNVLESASQAPVLASALNIAAFNVGNALGAWGGGIVIDHGPGLVALGAGAALISAVAVVISLVTMRKAVDSRMVLKR
ncbi:MFS transporter [Bdellovibrio bacteriovorus]|uniref:MFS transporter n=1 Tax=Bdellovibrio bacteriovorus TaxID=959 RepID=UPI003977888C